MKSLRDSKGNIYDLIEPEINSGGEGMIYELRAHPDLVAKIYKDLSSDDPHREKLEVMIRKPPAREDIHQFTWPEELLFDDDVFVGFIMRRIRNLVSVNLIAASDYGYSLKDRITVAKNLCSAINAVHYAGHVCGDLHPDNIMVDPVTAFVTLVDCDSFQIIDLNSQSRFACEAGLDSYLPREVQREMREGKKLTDAPWGTFSRYSDYFALSIHIFTLLMNVHPYKCSTDSDDDPKPEDNIFTGNFPYANLRSEENLPIIAPPYDYLPADIRSAFAKAFISGHEYPATRPDAKTWTLLLEKMENNLTNCKKDAEHHQYLRGQKSCPWCIRDSNVINYWDSNDTVSVSSTVSSGTTKQPIFHKAVAGPINNPTIAAAVPVTTPVHSPTYTNPGKYGQKSYAGLKFSTDITDFFSSTFGFWLATILLSVLTQVTIVHSFGNQISSIIIGTEYRNNIFYLGVNLAIWIGPIGISIISLTFMVLYNLLNDGRNYGYSPKNYLLSFLSTLLGIGAYYPLMWILSIFFGIFLIGLVLYILSVILS